MPITVPEFLPTERKWLRVLLRAGARSWISGYGPPAQTLTRLTSEDGQDNWPVWTLGGKRIAYAITRGTRGDKTGIYWKRLMERGEGVARFSVVAK